MTVPRTADPEAAARVLRAGGLVALPTETVYGLAADAEQPAAVARIYAVKGRPAGHPVIVHVAAADAVDSWTRAVPGYARNLVAACWPGPLTVVLPRSARATDAVTGGQSTVALRMPSHPVTLATLAAFAGDSDRGVAAPSANVFGTVSPTSVDHVLASIGDRLDPGRDLVLDGGACEVGVESTIVDCTGPAPRLLRPGAVSVETVEAVTGLAVTAAAGGSVRAPGTLAAHYAPRARVVVTPTTTTEPQVAAQTGPGSTGLIAPVGVPTPGGFVRLAAPTDASGYARILYAALRRADLLGLQVIVAVPPSGPGIAAAVRDRLDRAAAAGG
ncbi:MAG: threonylcarbamoyl-AMP synthase [Actinomycetota bacterium]|nr:MAG: threonylcarbamoyl-AMP synthase [Actinomycetota bacterium]